MKDVTDSLNKVIETTNDDTVKGRTILRLSAFLKKREKVDKSIELAKSTFIILQKSNDHLGIADYFLHV